MLSAVNHDASTNGSDGLPSAADGPRPISAARGPTRRNVTRGWGRPSWRPAHSARPGRSTPGTRSAGPGEPRCCRSPAGWSCRSSPSTRSPGKHSPRRASSPRVDCAHGPVARRLALTAASWAGLVGLERVAARSGEVLDAALAEGLGSDYRTRMAPAFAPPQDVPITRREVANPLPRLRRRYATTCDVAYGDLGRRNQLDVWRRADLPDDARAPVLIQVHGGAWVIGSKEQQGAALMGYLAERGLGERGGELPPLASQHVARPDRRREAGDRLGQGEHRRLRRRPGLHRHHRRLRRRAPLVAGCAHTGTRRLPAGIRGCRHQRAGRGAPVRGLRLREPRRHRSRRHGGHAVPARVQVEPGGCP